MSDTLVRSEAASETPDGAAVDIKLEVVVIPVSDVDRAKRFYGGLGWRLDADFTRRRLSCGPVYASGLRHVRCSSARGHRGRARARPSGACTSSCRTSRQRATNSLVAASRSAKCSTMPAGKAGVSGPDPERRSYCSWASFSDPDGNGWLLQEVTARPPGRVDADETSSALRPSSRPRCGVRRPPMANTRSGQAESTMRTGRTGTPRTWWRSRPARNCRRSGGYDVIRDWRPAAAGSRPGTGARNSAPARRSRRDPAACAGRA